MENKSHGRFCIMLRNTMVGTSDSFEQARTRAQQFANANPKLVITVIDRSSGDSHVVAPEF